MKRLKTICVTLAIALTMPLFFSGCYLVNSQKMKDVKGTYELTSYTYTPQYERREGYTPTTIDYVADKGYEVYLVVTGSGQGYYVHKDNQTDAYCKAVSLAYDYDEEDSSKVSYVKYKDVSDSNWNEFGVTRDHLNYSRPSINYTELFTKRQMATESVSKNWTRVDDATDLSYVKEKLGELVEYTSYGWSTRGLYEISGYYTLDDNELLPAEEFPYAYYYIAMNTSSKMTATIYYALKSDGVPIVETKTIALNENEQSVSIDGNEWLTDSYVGNFYQVVERVAEVGECGSYRINLTRVQMEFTQVSVQELINEKLALEPTE